MIRLVVKVIGDWTTLVQLRHPNEIGELYNVFSMAVTIIAGLAAANGYEKAEGANVAVSKETIVESMVLYCAGMTVSFVVLIYSMDRAYVGKFLSTKMSNSTVQEVRRSKCAGTAALTSK